MEYKLVDGLENLYICRLWYVEEDVICFLYDNILVMMLLEFLLGF